MRAFVLTKMRTWYLKLCQSFNFNLFIDNFIVCCYRAGCCQGYESRFVLLQYAIDMAIIVEHSNISQPMSLNLQVPYTTCSSFRGIHMTWIPSIYKHRHAMRAWAILWNVDNVDKTGRSEKMVEWWVIYLWCFSFLLWCWRSMSKMFFLLLLLLFSFLICKIDFEFDLHQTNCHSPRISWNKRFINSAKIDI